MLGIILAKSGALILKIKIIYPKWSKLERQTEFHLPPHGPVVFAATIPEEIHISFTDENREKIDFDEKADLIAISMMLTAQVKRGWEIADYYRQRGKKVIFGGIATMLHAEETMQHADSIFLGEAETRFQQVLHDFKNNKLKKVYDFLQIPPPIESVNTARRDILHRDLYNIEGIQMVDLTHASRGCRFNCYPCCVSYLGGRKFRPRPIHKVVEELAAIENNRIFFVDNSLAQDTKWELELFNAITPLKKKWISHPIEPKEAVLKAAERAGCWYVYQAVFDTSELIKNRIKQYKDHGIMVEGTILLGLDNHTEDYIKRLIDFLLEIDLDIAEFTILTPFPHTKAFKDLQSQNRIITYDWDQYTADKVVFQPKNISADRLQELYYYAWDTFYKDESQAFKMFKMFKHVISKEMEDNTFKEIRRKRREKTKNHNSAVNN